MGSIRSFDGRNCEWLIKYTRAVSGSPGSHSVATPWPPCWLIKYTRAVSVPYVPYSVATPWPAYIKVVAVKPLFSRHAASARRSEGEICTRSTRDKVVKWHIGENSIGRFFGGGRSTRSTRHRTPGGPGVLWRVERPARNAGTTGQDAVMTPS